MSMAMRWNSMPLALRMSASRDNSASGPDTAQRSGALTEAMSSPSPISARNSSSGSDTLSIPPAGTVSNSRPRSRIRSMQSSKLITPARHAAVFSPIEWPTMAAGVTPQLSHSLASANSTIMISGNCTEGRCSAFSAAARASSCRAGSTPPLPPSGNQSARMS